MINLNELNLQGWTEINNLLSDNELINLSKQLGQIFPHPNGKLIDILSAKDKKSAIKNTFSYTFEYGEFPLHTDTSFLQLPAKYVILSSFKSIDTSTTIININDFLRDATNEELALIKNSVYLVRTGALTFYTSLMCKANDKFIFRYDPQCMKPMNKAAMEAEELITKFSKVANKTKISWDNPKVLIIDNWQTLHGREALKENKSRTLKRIYIKN